MTAVKKVVVVFKTHFDLGFTDLPDKVMAAYTGPMFDAVRAVMATTEAEPPGARYTWTLPAWPLRYLLDSPTVSEARRATADALVRAGRLTWHAYPFTTHTAFCGLEDLVRGLQMARDLSERYGRRVTGAKQTDVPGHTWILPSLLVRAGVRFLHLGCNSGSSSPQVPRLFFWEGPDGARLLTYYSPGGYGTPLLPPPDWPFDTWLALQQTQDNHGPHQPEELRAMRAEIADAAPDIEVVFGELGDFAAALEANPAQLAQIPVVTYDLADTWIHGIGTMPREVARARALRGTLAAVESLAALRDPQDTAAESPMARLVEQAYEGLLLFGEHTWGLDVKSTITRVWAPADFVAARATEPYRRLEQSWVAKADYVRRAEAALDAAVAEVLQPAEAPDAPAPLAVYEPLGWGRDGWVECALPAGAPVAEGPVALEAPGSEPIAGETYDGRLRFPGQTSPLSLGAYVLRALPDSGVERGPAGAAPVLENEHFRLAIDPARGGISSLIEQATGYSWVDPHAEQPFGAYRYDLFSAADIAGHLRAYGLLFQDWFIADFGKAGEPENWPHLAAWAGDYTATWEHGPHRRTILLTGGTLRPTRNGPTIAPAQTVDLAITLYDHLPAVDLRYTVRGKGATPQPEAATAVFPLNLALPTFRLGQVGSVIDPSRQIAPGANHALWCVDNWLDAGDDRRGMGIFPLDAPLISIGSLGIYEYPITRSLDTPLVYGHLFNTQWGTNFPQWHEGDFTFRYRLWPHAGDWRTGRLWQHAWETTHPALAWAAGDAAPPVVGLEASEGLVVLAVKPRRDVPGLLVRVWDALGLPRTATITIQGAATEVRRCDLLEYPTEPLPYRVDGGHTTIPLAVAPHAVETLALAFA
jgi:hypothetical protein